MALALIASVGWGSADFLAGVKSRELPALTVAVTQQATGLLVVAIVVVIFGASITGPGFVLCAAVSGAVQTVGMVAYYRGLASGAMAVVAPVSAVAGLIPVAVGLARGERPGFAQMIGVGLALTGVALASYHPGPDGGRRVSRATGVGMALLAAGAFGTFYVFMDAATDRGDVVSAVLVNRITAVTLLTTGFAVGSVKLSQLSGRDLRDTTLIGLIAITASFFFAAATTKGLVSLVAVVAALYPISTILFARFVLSERVHVSQRLGSVAALLGVALIAS